MKYFPDSYLKLRIASTLVDNISNRYLILKSRMTSFKVICVNILSDHYWDFLYVVRLRQIDFVILEGKEISMMILFIQRLFRPYFDKINIYLTCKLALLLRIQ